MEEKSWKELIQRVEALTRVESKPGNMQVIKLMEEVGELAAEVIKLNGFTYKDFKKEDFYSEFADVFIMLFACFFKFAEETGLDKHVLKETITQKMDKWEAKVSTYHVNRKR